MCLKARILMVKCADGYGEEFFILMYKHLRGLKSSLWVVWLMLKYQGLKPAIKLLRHILHCIRKDIALAGVHRRYMKMRYGKHWRKYETNS